MSWYSQFVYYWCTLKALLCKNRFHFFLSHLLSYKNFTIFTYLFLSTLHFFNLLYQAKSLVRTIVSGSSSSKSLTRLILIWFTLRMLISLQQKVALPESSSKKSKPSSAYKGTQSFLILLLVTNQSGTNFNDARQLSTTSLQIFWVLSLSGQYTIKKTYKTTTMSHIYWVLYWSEIESNTKKRVLTAL